MKSPKHPALLNLMILLMLLVPFTVVGQSSSKLRWFEAETLNAGLGKAPPELLRSTPRQTLSQLLILGERNDFERAAHLLNLNELPEDEQAERGPELARKLLEVIDRTMVIDWDNLPARPDALLEANSEMALAGQPRRSLGLSMLELERRPVEIRISRIKPEEGEAVWVFSSQTVHEIDTLYERYGPGWFEEQMPSMLRSPAFFDTRAWEWLVLPLVVGLLVVLGWVTYRFLKWFGHWLPVTWINRAADHISMPLSVALMALLMHLLAEGVVGFSAFFYSVLTPLLMGLIIVGITVAILRSIDATLDRITERFVDEIDDSYDSDRRELYTSIYALRRLVLLAAVLISGALFVSQLRLFDNIGLSLLASAGVVTVILGIAGRSVLGNILASLQIAVSKPVRIGDVVQYEDYWGYVEAIYYSYLIVRVWDGRRVIVPVQYFISHPFENWSMVDARTSRRMSLRLDPSAEPNKLRKAFEKLVAKDDRVIEDEILMTGVTVANEDYLEVTFFATAGNPKDAWMIEMELLEGMTDWIRRYHPEWWPRDRVSLNRSSEVPASSSEGR